MAFYGVDVTGAGVQITQAATDGVDYILAGTFIGSSDDTSYEATASRVSLTVAGSIVSLDAFDTEPTVDMSGIQASVRVLAGGSIISADMDSGSYAVQLTSATGTVLNWGEIIGGGGVRATGGNTYIENHGVISGSSTTSFLYTTGIILASEIEDDPNPNVVINYGMITGGPGSSGSYGGAIHSNASPSFAGDSESIDHITNYGTLNGWVMLGGLTDILVNGGLINGDIAMTEGADTTADELHNSGTIVTDGVYANRSVAHEQFEMTDGDNLLTNSGTIVTNTILMGLGADTVRNSGVIDADVSLGDGADTYIGQLDGFVTGQVHGRAGEDTMKGSETNDDFRGGDDLDYLYGRGGDDELHGEGTGDMIFGGGGDDLAFGGSGSDVMHGGTGDDELQGGAKNDKLKGQTGNDLLIGNSGDDDVYGGAGDDILIGGQGADGMNGGTGADTFVFESTADMGLGGDRDSIRGFSVAEDVLDFSEIDWDLLFIGTDSFNGTGDTEVRLKEKSNGNTNVSIDENGDGVTDYEIILFNTLGLTEDNFAL